MENKILEIQDLKRILPQRYPFLMIDRVVESGIDKVVAIKNVTVNENFFQGHFPDEKVMPGVLIIEAMAQTGIVLVYNAILSKEKNPDSKKKKIYFLGGVNKTRFFQSVFPGDQLKIIATPIKLLSRIGIVTSEAFVEDKKVAQSELSFSVKEVE
ncbi:3-hydroxyacyl-ACP dehydratase FabZ [Candidatus Omnitrophota bacterium]